MKLPRNNLVAQFAVASFAIMAMLAVSLTMMLAARLDRSIELLRDHGIAMMTGTMIEDTDPISIASIAGGVQHLQWVTAGAIAGAFVVLFTVLITIVWRGARTITRQRLQLESFNTQLEAEVERRTSDLQRSNDGLSQALMELESAQDALEVTAEQRSKALALAENRADALRHTNEELDALFRIASLLAAPGPFEENARKMLVVVAEIVRADRAVLRLPDEEQRGLVVVASAGLLAVAHPPVELASGTAGASGRAFENREVVIEHDHEPGGRTGRAIDGDGARSNVTLPITWGESVCGVLKVGSKHRDFFSDDSVNLLTAIANSLGVLIENARLRGSLEQSIEDLKSETAERTRATESLEVERALRVRVDNFVSIASHELRTPMTTLVGYSELLLTNEPPKNVRREWFRLINEECSRLTEILDELLDLSRINAGTVRINLQPLALPPIARQLLQGLELASSNHQFELEGLNDVPDVIGDRDKLFQVLGNLLNNAVKYSPDGGQISVWFQSDDEHSRVITSVRDQGIGIAPRDHARVFEMFHRARLDEAIRGTGLGLHVVKSYVELMGGTVWVRSRRHHGSTFSFALPIAKPAPQEAAETLLTPGAMVAEGGSGRRRRIPA